MCDEAHTACQYNVSGLTHATSYQISIIAVSFGGQSKESEALVASTAAQAPSPARDISVALSVNSDSVTTDAQVTWLASGGNGEPVGSYNVTACDVDAQPSSADLSFCGTSDCSAQVLATFAGQETCQSRINWLSSANGGGHSRYAACSLVAGEFPSECGLCDIAWDTCYTVSVLGTTTQTYLTSLPAGRNYTIAVEAFNSIGSSGKATARGLFTSYDKPMQGIKPAQAVALSNLDAKTDLHVIWAEPWSNGYEITAYDLKIDDSVIVSGLTRDPHVQQYTLTGLHPGTTHTFSVRAVNERGEGAFSPTLSLTTQDSMPGLMGRPSINSMNASTITIAIINDALYSGGQPITGYYLRVRTNPASIDNIVSLQTAQLPTTYVMHNRQTNLDYIFQVAAENSNGRGDWSQELEVSSTTSELPSSPASFEVDQSSVDATSFDVSWSIPANNQSASVSHYRLEMQYLVCEAVITNCTSTSGVLTTSYQLLYPSNCTAGMSCTATVSGANVEPATTYDLRLTAESAVGSSIPTAVVSVSTSADVPQMPVAPTVVDVQNSSVMLSWSTPRNNGAEITLYRCVACLEDNSICYPEIVLATSSATTNCTVSSLPSAQNFTLAVEAINSIGSSGNQSAPGIHTTLAAPMRGYSPTWLAPLPGLSPKTTIRVTWASPFANGLPITNYVLTINGVPVTVPASNDAPQYSVVGLNPGTVVTFTSSAVNLRGRGEESLPQSFETERDVPGKPPIPVALSVNATTLVIQAQPPPFDGGELVSRYEFLLVHANNTVESLMSGSVGAVPDLLVINDRELGMVQLPNASSEQQGR